jgi:hypothetical protein
LKLISQEIFGNLRKLPRHFSQPLSVGALPEGIYPPVPLATASVGQPRTATIEAQAIQAAMVEELFLCEHVRPQHHSRV